MPINSKSENLNEQKTQQCVRRMPRDDVFKQRRDNKGSKRHPAAEPDTDAVKILVPISVPRLKRPCLFEVPKMGPPFTERVSKKVTMKSIPCTWCCTTPLETLT